MSDLLKSASAISNSFSFGDVMVDDPRGGYPDTYPWWVTFKEEPTSQKLSIEIFGIPTNPVNVGEMFEAYIIIEGKRYQKSDCAANANLPMSDIIKVSWDIYNGPEASVTVTDMHNLWTVDAQYAIPD